MAQGCGRDVREGEGGHYGGNKSISSIFIGIYYFLYRLLECCVADLFYIYIFPSPYSFFLLPHTVKKSIRYRSMRISPVS